MSMKLFNGHMRKTAYVEVENSQPLHKQLSSHVNNNEFSIVYYNARSLLPKCDEVCIQYVLRVNLMWSVWWSHG